MSAKSSLSYKLKYKYSRNTGIVSWTKRRRRRHDYVVGMVKFSSATAIFRGDKNGETKHRRRAGENKPQKVQIRSFSLV